MYTSNNDMLKEIDLIKIRLGCYNTQKTLLLELMYAFTSPVRELKGMVYSDMPSGGQQTDYSVYIEGMRILETKIEIENRILNNMLETIRKLDDKMKEFKGLDYKVAYLIQSKGFTVQEVADELGYSFTYIQNISAKVNKIC